jgi:hypothetical protein
MMSQSKAKFVADRSIFSSTQDLSFIFSSTPDLSIFFTSGVLFLEYFEFYQHSTPAVSSNQMLGILEAFNNMQYKFFRRYSAFLTSSIVISSLLLRMVTCLGNDQQLVTMVTCLGTDQQLVTMVTYLDTDQQLVTTVTCLDSDTDQQLVTMVTCLDTDQQLVTTVTCLGTDRQLVTTVTSLYTH